MAMQPPPVLDAVKQGYVATAEGVGYHISGAFTGAVNGAISAATAPSTAFVENLKHALNAEEKQDRFKYGSYAVFNLLRYPTTFPIEFAWNTISGGVQGALVPQTAGRHKNLFNANRNPDAPGEGPENEAILPAPHAPDLNIASTSHGQPPRQPKPQDQGLAGLMGPQGPGRGGTPPGGGGLGGF